MTLIPDTAAIQQTLTALNTGATKLTQEAGVLASADLQSLAWAIVYAKFPSVYSSMQAEQQNAAAFVALNVMPDITTAIKAFAGTFQAQSGQMLTILTQAGSSPLTPAQQQALNAAMAALLAGLSALVQFTQAKSAKAAALSDVISNPSGNFVTGENAVQASIDSTNQNMQQLQQMLNAPGADTQAIGMGIVADQEIIDWLQNLLSTLQGMVQANKDMGAQLSQTLIAWQSLVDKYQYVANQVKQAGSGAGILAPGDIHSAQLAWTQIETFAQGLSPNAS
jgi:hypothetical protein